MRKKRGMKNEREKKSEGKKEKVIGRKKEGKKDNERR